MTTTREETSMNPLIQAKEESSPVIPGEAFPKKESLTPKVTPLQETPGKDKVLSTFESTLMNKSMSNEDLKAVYERKKNHRGTQFVLLENPSSENRIFSLALTPDNKFLLCGCFDKSIRIYDLQSKKLVHKYEQIHEFGIRSLAVTKDKKYFISGSADYSIKVFDFETKEEVHHFKKVFHNTLRSVAVTSDDRFLIASSETDSVKLFDLKTKQEVHRFQAIHSYSIPSVLITSDDKYMITGSQDKTMKIFDFQTKKEVHHFQNVHLEEIHAVALAPNNKFIASCSKDKSIKIFDIETKQEVYHFENAHDSEVRAVTFTPDSRFIISGSKDGSVKIFDLEIKQQVHYLKKLHKDSVSSLVVTSDSKSFISASLDGSIKMFDLEINYPAHHFKEAQDSSISSIILANKNRQIIAGSQNGSIRIFDIETKELIHDFPRAFKNEVGTMVTTSDKKLLIAAGAHLIKVFDLETKQQVHIFKNPFGSWITSVVLTSDDRFIVAGSWDRSIKVYDLQTKTQVHNLEDKTRVNSVVLTPNNKYFLSAHNDGSIKMFDWGTKKLVHHFQKAHQGEVKSIATTPDNKFVISGSTDKSIKIFDIETKQQVHHFQNIHEHEVHSVIVTADNRYIISASEDQSIKVFDLQTKQEIRHLRHPDRASVDSAVANNHKVAVASDNSSIVCDFWGRDLLVYDFEKQSKEELDQEFYCIYKEMKNFSIFNSADYFLFGKSTEYAISYAKKRPELSVLPFRWNILHIVSVYANYEFIENMPDYSQFRMPFLLDISNKTPLHYLLAHKNVNFITANIMFRYICEYLQECYAKNPFEFQKIVESLDPLLPFILEKVDVKTKQKFLRIVDSKSPVPFRNPAPIFGHILSESAFLCDSPVLTQETRDKIWNEEGTTQVEFRSNFLRLDYDILSQDMNIMVDCLKAQEGEEVFKMPVIMRLIDHLWGQAEIPLLIFFAIYSAFIIALSVYLTLPDRSLAYEIVLLVTSVGLTANEFWQMFHLKKSYLESVWNWIDMTHLLLTIAFLITRIADDDNELARAWISTNIIILGYIRWISLLKIFKPTRNLIQVVITIIKEMLSFIIIIALIIVAFSLIFLVFNREAGYGDYLYEAYNVMYGPMDIEEDAAWPFSQKLLMAILAFFLNVVLLNLLISIMGDSYGQVLEMRDRTDALTRLEMISEAIIYKKFFKRSHETKRGFLVYCLPLEWEEDENNQELENNIKAIKKVIDNTNEKFSSFEASHEIIRNKMSSVEAKNDKMEKKISSLENEIVSLKETILSEFSKLKSSKN